MAYLQSPAPAEIVNVTPENEQQQGVELVKYSINDTSQIVSINGLIQSPDNYYFQDNYLFFKPSAPILTGDIVTVHYLY